MFSTYLRKSSLSVFSLRSFTLKRPGRNEKVLVTSIYGSRSRRTPEEEEEFQQRNNEIKNFHTHVKELQIQPSIDIFREWKKKNNDPLQANIYNSLFSLFRKADHLPIATGTITFIKNIYSKMK